ncbi:hypothetical protein ROHU_017862 [Labeo rohita]|uniref:Uncharacterized protein n=1 Tax=Labeo rohita TaxID=84645 RepID=A0A498NAV4_LABRO|nr:hypothetical protein ROHU_005436 [Labeo rohita]RXN30231.1 hypothetical protein ROHU_017862 [Labeo rohita]
MPCFGKVNAPLGRGARGLKTAAAVRSQKTAKGWVCQKWDSNPRLQGRLRPERSALDRSAILTRLPDGSRPVGAAPTGTGPRS